MQIDRWWPLLSEEARHWLVEHNGDADPSWWSGDSGEGLSELTDDSIDWIEAVANEELPPRR